MIILYTRKKDVQNKQKALYKFHKFRIIKLDHRAFYNKNHQNYNSDTINHKYNLLCKVCNSLRELEKKTSRFGMEGLFFCF